MFDDEKDKPKATWEKITVKKILTLSDLDNITEIEY